MAVHFLISDGKEQDEVDKIETGMVDREGKSKSEIRLDREERDR